VEFSLQINNEDLQKQMRNENVERVTIAVTIPDEVINNDKIELNQILLDSELLKTAGEEKKDISVVIKDESGKERCSWSFRGEELAASQNSFEDINLAMSVERVSEWNDQMSQELGGCGLVLNFKHEGLLPAPAQVRVYVGDIIGEESGSGIDVNKKVYLYYYNAATGKLESLPYSSGYRVDKDGYITIDLVHCSDYVILPKAAGKSILTPIKDQITITVDRKTLSTKGIKKTAQIQVQLPSTLELVGSLDDKTSSDSIGAVIVSYESSNDKVTKVDSNGKITAIGKGKATITVTFTLYSGKTKTYKITIAVK
ncbi:MAG TPA: Ig-like domain-containing protein, partial [Mobilitalea sp.]|nr:Ig-like domain-containing protein [Mobilitalea sp.]